jgi:HlyD family secretion protein
VVAATGAVVAIGFALKLWPVRVTVVRVVRGTAIEAVYATGTIEALERVTVKARTSGAIVSMVVREGARVKRGDLLAVIDARTLEAELARARAESWAASRQATADSPQLAALAAQAAALEAELGNARVERERAEALSSAGAVAPAENERAATRVGVLEAQLAAVRAQQRALAIEISARATSSSATARAMAARVSDAEVRAPIDGVILAREVEPGEAVGVGQPLFRIGDTDHLLLESAVDEADIGKVLVGNRAAVALYAFPGKAFAGRVVEILPDADRARRSFLVKVSLDDPPAGLRSGMSAEVNLIVAERPDALIVPADAVDARGAAWVVAGGRARHRILNRGTQDHARLEVSGDVAEGDALVIVGADGLEDGARVRARYRPFEASSSPHAAEGP